jgi:hypothetical protein
MNVCLLQGMGGLRNYNHGYYYFGKSLFVYMHFGLKNFFFRALGAEGHVFREQDLNAVFAQNEIQNILAYTAPQAGFIQAPYN